MNRTNQGRVVKLIEKVINSLNKSRKHGLGFTPLDLRTEKNQCFTRGI